MGITVATDATFQGVVVASGRPVLVDFWAPWAGPCAMLARELEVLATRYEGRLDIVTVDVDANPGVVAAYGVQSVPTLALLVPGQPPQGLIGYRPAAEIEAAFDLARLSASPPPASAGALEEIRRLGQLRDQGILTEDEFAQLKARLLGTA